MATTTLSLLQATRALEVIYPQGGWTIFGESPTRINYGSLTPVSDEQLISTSETAVSNSVIKAQIAALEDTQTLRRMREAANGTDNGWLKNLDTEIANLRAQLQSI